MKKLIPVLLLSFSVAASASELKLQFENDFPFHDDSDYTHGTRIEYTTSKNLRFGLQQQIYTPFDIKNTEQIEGRHPYAGYLAAFAGKKNVRFPFERLAEYSDFELQIGILGPSSKAEDVQKLIHKWLDCKYPAGWDYQLHDEAEIQAFWWEGANYLLFGSQSKWHGTVEAEVGALFGTLQDAFGGNMNLKIGYGFPLANTYNEIRIRSTRKPPFEAYVLAGIEGRWWLWNEFLDGNAHYIGNHDTKTVDKEPLTGLWKWGVGLKVWRLDLQMLVLHPAREYKTQESTPDYASFSLGFTL